MDLAFELSQGVIRTLTIRWQIDTVPGTPQSTFCGATSSVPTLRINDASFSFAGGNLFPVAFSGAFTSPESASGSFEVSANNPAQPWCLDATIAWTAVTSPDGTPPTTTLGGIVTDVDRQPLSGARVTVLDGPNRNQSVETNAEGEYLFSSIWRGNTNFRATKSGYHEALEGVFVDGTARLDFSLAPPALSGIVTDTDGAPVSGARVTVLDGPNMGQSVQTNANGEYVFLSIASGNTNFTATKDGYREDRRGVFVNGTNRLAFSIALMPTKISGRVYAGTQTSAILLYQATVEVISPDADKGLKTLTNFGGYYVLEGIKSTTFRVRYTDHFLFYQSVEREFTLPHGRELTDQNVLLPRR